MDCPEASGHLRIPETELWASFPEATRTDVLRLLGMLLERLAVSACLAEGPSVSTVLIREPGDGKIQGWQCDRLAVVYLLSELGGEFSSSKADPDVRGYGPSS